MNKQNYYNLLVCIILISLLILIIFIYYNMTKSYIECSPSKATSFTGIVNKISDGDTILVTAKDGNYVIRLLGIDTPELNYQERSMGEWAEKALVSLEKKIPVGTQVKIEYDKSPCDTHKRHLGYVIKGGIDINGSMIDDGLAVNYCVYPNMSRCMDYAHRMERSLIRNSFARYIELPYEFRWKNDNQRSEKAVADMRETQVHSPEYYSQIPIPFRLFFTSEEPILPPYHQ
jgi:micrococcal nuclease